MYMYVETYTGWLFNVWPGEYTQVCQHWIYTFPWQTVKQYGGVIHHQLICNFVFESTHISFLHAWIKLWLQLTLQTTVHS